LVWNNQELFPAMHCNLLLFKEKSKRIFVSIGARAAVFRRKFQEKEDFAPLHLCQNHRKGKKIQLCDLCQYRLKEKTSYCLYGKTTQNRENPDKNKKTLHSKNRYTNDL